MHAACSNQIQFRQVFERDANVFRIRREAAHHRSKEVAVRIRVVELGF